MIDKPQITNSNQQLTAVIHVRVPRAEIQAAMGSAITEVMQTVAAQGIGPAGPVYSLHFRMDPAVFDFEVGVPVSRAVTPTGRVQEGQIPATTVARTVYRGPYEGLGAAWGEFMAWIEGSGHQPAGNLWEIYAKGPESSPNPADWCTELNRPLAS